MKERVRVAAAILAMVAIPGGANAESPDLHWLTGHWCSDDGTRRIDEVWLPAVAGAMHGLSRTIAGERVESFEFMRIEAEAGTTRFLAQPNGAPPTAFVLVEHDANRASFANPAHDFPDRIDYRREGHRLHARISGPGRDGPMQIPFDFHRCD